MQLVAIQALYARIEQKNVYGWRCSSADTFWKYNAWKWKLGPQCNDAVLMIGLKRHLSKIFFGMNWLWWLDAWLIFAPNSMAAMSRISALYQCRYLYRWTRMSSGNETRVVEQLWKFSFSRPVGLTHGWQLWGATNGFPSNRKRLHQNGSKVLGRWSTH